MEYRRPDGVIDIAGSGVRRVDFNRAIPDKDDFMAAARSQLEPALSGARPKTDPAAPFQMATLIRRCMNDTELAARLLEKFAGRLAGSLKHLQRMLEVQDWPGAASKAHELKGEAGSLAAVELHCAVAELEHALRGGRYAEAPARFAAVKSQAARCALCLPAVLTQLGRSNPAESTPTESKRS
jgi:HPt (histidine-containing phosphotransfer) domain-containing protein